jgi:hypothetical protein
MEREMWAVLLLVLGSTVWMMYLLRQDLRQGCPARVMTSEPMTTIENAFEKPKELPLTKSSEPGVVQGFHPVHDRFASAEWSKVPASAAPSPVAFPLSSDATGSAVPEGIAPQAFVPFPSMTR